MIGPSTSSNRALEDEASPTELPPSFKPAFARGSTTFGSLGFSSYVTIFEARSPMPGVV